MATTDPAQTPDIWAFLREIVARLKARNPKFFNVLAFIGALASAITGLPAILAAIPGLHLPEAFAAIQNSIISVAGIVVFVMSNLAVQRPVTIVESTPQGEIVTKVLDGSTRTLPFTEKVEAKKLEAQTVAAENEDTLASL